MKNLGQRFWSRCGAYLQSLRRDPRAFGLLAILGFSMWIAFNWGRVSVSLTEERFLSQRPDARMSVAQLVQSVDQYPGGYLIVLPHNEVRYLSPNDKKLYLIEDFSEAATPNVLDKLMGKLRMSGKVSFDFVPASHGFNFFDQFNHVVLFVMNLFFLGFFVLMIVVGGAKIKSGGLPWKKRFKRYDSRVTQPVLFADVIGYDGVKAELKDVVEYLRNPSAFDRLGAKPPSGVLLYGPPGNGKTLLARAVAGEGEASFLEQPATSFVRFFVGGGADAVRDLFDAARKSKPCVIFIDEFDAVGGSRDQAGTHEERAQTLNQLLTEMDGFTGRDGVVVIAATNRRDVLDEALIRPGRFSRHVHVPQPALSERRDILMYHAKKLPAIEIDFQKMAENTQGFSGAALANLVNEAAVEAAREGADKVGERHGQMARERILRGARNVNSKMLERDKKFAAVHELGHAVTQIVVAKKKVEKVSILPRGESLGATLFQDEEERLLHTQEEIKETLAVMMGGRAAELVFLKTVTSGARDDMEKASALAREAVCRLGFDAFGPYVPKNEDLLKETEIRAADWVKDSYVLTQGVLEQNRAAVEFLWEDLLNMNELPGDYIEAVINAFTNKSELPARPYRTDIPSKVVVEGLEA